MKIVGLTGGIGSGKSTVAAMFQDLGVPVYIADLEAKKLTNTSKKIRKKIKAILGKDSFNGKIINAEYIANKVFKDESLLKDLNAIIHPRVAEHFRKWVEEQEGHYCIKEAAILFESGSYKDCDITILVKSPKELRINRILERDRNTTVEEIESRMKNQWNDSKKENLSDIVIENIDLEKTQQKVKEIHLFLLKS
jgi:dephospho-CoA kinase